MWSVWCRAAVGALLMALGASLEFYDQLPATNDLLYQDDNDIDTGPSEQVHLPKASDVMMWKLVKGLQLQRSADARLSNRPPSFPLEEAERRIEHAPDTNTFKDSVFKRLAEVFGGPGHAHRALEQQKWKIKKGKLLGSHMVCYFKLCAFRSPA